MPQIQPVNLDLPDFHGHPVRSAGEDTRGVRWGLAVAGASLGGVVGLVAAFAAGIPGDNPITWLAVASAVAIGAVLGA